MKVSKKKSASYSMEENRFGKWGMCHKYLTDSEMRSFTASCIEDKKQMQKDSAQDIDLHAGLQHYGQADY
jgi:hypothetical protein